MLIVMLTGTVGLEISQDLMSDCEAYGRQTAVRDRFTVPSQRG